MGNKNARAIALLQEEVQTGGADVILHVGDLAYDMADVCTRWWPRISAQIVPFQDETDFRMILEGVRS